MMHGSPPFERSPFLRCVISPCGLDGKILVTRNSALPDKLFGSKQRDRICHSERSRLPRRSFMRRLGGNLWIFAVMSSSVSKMRVITMIAEAQPYPKRRVLVPTMGALHKAHGEMVRVASKHAGHDGEVALSIFVNPLQFEPGSDYERYPRSEKTDEEFCRNAGVDLLFRPSVAEMYADDRSVFVEESFLSNTLEGKSRPGHFRGVCTVVAKLFNVLSPDAALFGEKDFQQLVIVRRMVRDLNFKTDIIAVPTVREEDGLACSSRNQYLNIEERKQAPVLHRALLAAANAGNKSAREIVELVSKVIDEAPLARIDYVEVADSETLQPLETVRPNSLIALAVSFGKTRLIDNIRLG